MARRWRSYAAVAVIAVATVACDGAADDVNDPALPGAGAPTAGGSPSGVQPTVAESPTDAGDDDDGGNGGNADNDDADVTARNLAYEPAQVRVEAGDDLEVENADTTVDHTFTIEGEDIDEIVPAGDEIEFRLDLDPGTYTAICRFHDGMRVRVEIT